MDTVCTELYIGNNWRLTQDADTANLVTQWFDQAANNGQGGYTTVSQVAPPENLGAEGT